MNPSPQTLSLLLERAEAERDAAQRRAQRAAETARRLVLQAEQLGAYRDEYRLRSPAPGGQGTPIEILRCQRDFMQRLDQALALLCSQVEACEREAQSARAALLAHETRVASVRKLIERRLQEHQRGAARQEQRRSDEAATRATWSARNTLNPH